MGVVYSPEQVRLREVPEADGSSHQMAAKELFQTLSSSELRYQGVGGVLIYGSTAEGTATRRSDLDVLVVSDDYLTVNVELIEQLRGIFTDVHARSHVSIEPQIVRSSDLLQGNHTIDSLFLNHLLRAQRNPEFSVGWPVSIIAKDAIQTATHPAIPDILLKYVAAKNKKFASSLLSSSDNVDAYKVLQRALEFPSSLGRKVVALLASPGSNVNEPGLRELAVRGLFSVGSYGQKVGHESFVKLQNANSEYSDILEQALAGEIDSEQYSKILNALSLTALRHAVILAEASVNSIGYIAQLRKNQARGAEHRFGWQEELPLEYPNGEPHVIFADY